MKFQPTAWGHPGLNFATNGTAAEETIVEKILPLRTEKLIQASCYYHIARISSTLFKPSIVSYIEITRLHLSFLRFFLTILCIEIYTCVEITWFHRW